jgi:cytochrome c-type biogenesis protein CcmF
MRPDLTSLDEVLTRVDRKLERATPEIGPSGPSPAEIEAMRRFADAQGDAIENFAALYLARPLPVDFRINLNPLVIWIWVGGGIALGGALFALWPAPAAARRRVTELRAARLARELGRA